MAVMMLDTGLDALGRSGANFGVLVGGVIVDDETQVECGREVLIKVGRKARNS